ncbi:MAG: amidohydrolase family protein [Hyphomonas sp.]|nr:amidohydrolase family protein [Hyphomonas sp.]
MKRKVIDAHHHLWKLDELHYPWLSEPLVHPLPGLGDIAAIQTDYTAQDFLADTSVVDLVGSVHVEAVVRPDLAQAETNWLNAVADRHGLPTAIVPFLDLLADDARAQADAIAQTRRVVGVRQILNWDSGDPTWNFADQDLLRSRAARRSFAHLARLGLRFEAQVWHQQFSDLAQLADDTGLQIAINHCGMPRSLEPDYLNAWSEALSVFADQPSVSMKFSGMTMFCRNWTAQSANPVFDRLVEVFGPDRLMFGSNFPVDRIGVSYANCIDRASQLVQRCDPDIAEAFFATNAVRFYGLDADG